ncbi:MAG: methylenetetrahydrofolate reductase [Deltaproteobacteria bacterium]|nr:methylenetetrahydrofolate reductase [Deltaproteobacteria bacterium]MBW1942448.1 methylenetetrahydrofolate reductase [Deltaproteobacteria bacterium]
MLLKEKIKSGEFIVLAEFETPKGADFTPLLKHAEQIKGRLDALVIPEMANAVMKASSLGGCAYFQKQGIETVLQVCCRDRNRLALQADLLAAGALEIRNIMALSGEDIRFGDHPQAREVHDLNLLELLESIQKLQQGKDLAGIELRGTPQFCTGSTIDSGAPGGLLELELENLLKMIDYGVEYVVTKPVFDVRRFQEFVKRVDTSRVAVIPTVLLLKSAGMARYIDRNIKGISIPPEMIRGIQKAPDKVQECIRIAGELISRLKEMGMAGVYISTVGWEDKLPQLMGEAKI